MGHRERWATRATRRARTVQVFADEFSAAPESALSRFRSLAAADKPVVGIMSGDIDGLVTAMLLADALGWKVGAIVHRPERILVHADFPGLTDLIFSDEVIPFGVDIFSFLFSSISN